MTATKIEIKFNLILKTFEISLGNSLRFGRGNAVYLCIYEVVIDEIQYLSMWYKHR